MSSTQATPPVVKEEEEHADEMAYGDFDDFDRKDWGLETVPPKVQWDKEDALKVDERNTFVQKVKKAVS